MADCEEGPIGQRGWTGRVVVEIVRAGPWSGKLGELGLDLDEAVIEGVQVATRA